MPGLWIDRLAPEAVRIQGSKTIVVAASPGRLRAEDERMAGGAEATLGSLTWDGGAAGHHPAGAAGVPMARAAAQVADGSGGKLHIAASLGRLLELVGLARYTAICRGPRTGAVLQVYEGGGRESFWGSRPAQERSGVGPAGPARAAAVVRQGAGDGRAGGRCLRLGGDGAGPCGRWRRAAPRRQGWRAAERRTADCPRPAGRAAMAAGGWSAAPRWRAWHTGSCARGAGPRARIGGTACPRHRSPARPVRPMAPATGGGDREPGSAAAPARRKPIFWAESWRELARGSWSHRDL
jgi:hypothetical protein